MSKATQKALSELHGEFARKLRDILKSGQDGEEAIGASHLNVIRQFLKDNHIDAAPGNEDVEGVNQALRESLPFKPTEQDEYGPVQ